MLIISPKELALAVVAQRKKLGLSQGEVGKKVGVKQQTVSQFELRPEGTKLNTLFQILSAVNLEIKISEKNEKEISVKWKEEW